MEEDRERERERDRDRERERERERRVEAAGGNRDRSSRETEDEEEEELLKPAWIRCTHSENYYSNDPMDQVVTLFHWLRYFYHRVN